MLPTAPQTPIAAARRAGTVCARTRPSEAGIMPAAPMPCSVRAATSSGRFGAIPLSSEAQVNRPVEITNSRRRPRMSATRPATASSAAKTTV